MNIELFPVNTKEDIEKVVNIGKICWFETYSEIISKEQINFMLDKFQSTTSIKNQIENENYQYFIVKDKFTEIGYLGIKIENNELFISKFYLYKEYHGKGYASKIFDNLNYLSAENNLKSIWLTVNRNNSRAISFYKKRGFNITKEEKKDIGNGFFMDDYIMKKKYNEF